MKKDIEMSLARLPVDIQAFVKRKVALCITIFLLAEAIAVLLITSMLNSSFKLEPISLAVVCALLVLCPFLISRFPRKLIDKPWRGKITKVDIDTKVDSRLVGGKPIVYVKNTIVLTIEKENGKVCTKEVLSLGSRSNNFFSDRNVLHAPLQILHTARSASVVGVPWSIFQTAVPKNDLIEQKQGNICLKP